MQAKPLLVMFIGGPGSGKTTFAIKLADKLGAVRFNSDAMRLAVFGSLDEIQKVYESNDRKRVNSYTFGAMDYATGQLLSSGIDVVYDAIQRTYEDRRKMQQLADQYDANLVLIWVKTDEEVAIKRVMQREATNEARRFDEQKAKEVIAHFRDGLDIPTEDERYIEIPGDCSFEEQYSKFEAALSEKVT